MPRSPPTRAQRVQRIYHVLNRSFLPGFSPEGEAEQYTQLSARKHLVQKGSKLKISPTGFLHHFVTQGTLRKWSDLSPGRKIVLFNRVVEGVDPRSRMSITEISKKITEHVRAIDIAVRVKRKQYRETKLSSQRDKLLREMFFLDNARSVLRGTIQYLHGYDHLAVGV